MPAPADTFVVSDATAAAVALGCTAVGVAVAGALPSSPLAARHSTDPVCRPAQAENDFNTHVSYLPFEMIEKPNGLYQRGGAHILCSFSAHLANPAGNMAPVFSFFTFSTHIAER